MKAIDNLVRRGKTALSRFYRRFLVLRGAPREIALGLSLGILIGMSPFFGAHLVASLLLASLLGWSKIAALLGVNITNVFTAPLIYPITYWVGAQLTGLSKPIAWPMTAEANDWFALVQQSPLILVDLIVGGLVVGVPLAVAAYFVTLRLVRLYRRPQRAQPRAKTGGRPTLM